MNKVLMCGRIEGAPEVSFLPAGDGVRSLVEVCRGMLACRIGREREHYPFLAQGRVCGELVESARRGRIVDVGGTFRHVCWENENMEGHLSYYFLVTDVYPSDDASMMVSDEGGEIQRLVGDGTLFPMNLVRYDALIRTLRREEVELRMSERRGMRCW